MIFVFNKPGAIILGISLIMAFLFGPMFSAIIGSGKGVLLFVGIIWISMDLIARKLISKKRKGKKHKNYGGTFFFIPFYIWGIIACVLFLLF